MAISSYPSFFKVLKNELININSNDIGVLWRSILIGTLCPPPVSEDMQHKIQSYLFSVQDDEEKATFKDVIGFRAANIFAWPYLIVVFMKKFSLEGVERLTLYLTDKKNKQISPVWAIALKTMISIVFTPAQLVTFLIAKLSDGLIDNILKPLKKLSSTGAIFHSLKKNPFRLNRIPRYRFNKRNFWGRPKEQAHTEEEVPLNAENNAVEMAEPKAVVRANQHCYFLSDHSLELIKKSFPNNRWSISQTNYDVKKAPYRVVYDEHNQQRFTIDATGLSTNEVDLGTYIQMLKCFKAAYFHGELPYATMYSTEAKDLMQQAYRVVYGNTVNVDLFITLQEKITPRARL